VEEQDVPDWEAVGGSKPTFPVRAARGLDGLRVLLDMEGTVVWVVRAARCAPMMDPLR
jgi:hypothetical protein